MADMLVLLLVLLPKPFILESDRSPKRFTLRLLQESSNYRRGSTWVVTAIFGE